jgi:2,4-dienoyl-CoA reductase-like NADH-dependent reductase (Old Yellow Enzyme family)/thioredoxin reductase
MSFRYSALLSPIKIGDTVIKNRTMYPNASPHFLQGPETYPADSYVTFLSGLARNGAAIITLAEWSNPNQRSTPVEDAKRMQNFDYTDPGNYNYFTQMADDVHFYGSKLLLCTDLKYPDGYTLDGKSFGPPGAPGKPTQALPKELMPQVIEDFLNKIQLFADFGYDGIAMRVEMLLNPNNRTDEYGGPMENRVRLLHEALAAVKKRFGKSFIVELCVAGEQPNGYTGGSHGYTLEDTIEFAKCMEDVADILQLRESDMTKSHPTGFTFQKGQHETIRYSMALKAAGCKILTEPVGGFQDPEEINAYIAEGKCDMIGMARAFMADPQYGEKLYEGRGEDVVPCLWCNKCHGTMSAPYMTFCSVNPVQGIAHKIGKMVDDEYMVKKVAVIGGGPVGMKAAIVAAERGHDVTLFEKTDYLGGQLRHSDYSSFKWPVRDFKNYLVRRLGQLDIEVRMNTLATPELLEQEGFEAVLAATGATPNVPDIQGLKDDAGALKPEYKVCLDVYGHEAELGHHVICIGGSETAIETAMYLAENGHDVTLLTRQDELAKDASHLHYITMAWVKTEPDGRSHMAAAWEKYEGIRGILKATTVKVDGTTVTYVQDGQEKTISGDSVILSGGMNPNVDEALSFAGIAPKFFVIGDANRDGNIQRGMRDAFSKALQL